MTPAMKAGVSRKLWTVEDLVGLAEWYAVLLRHDLERAFRDLHGCTARHVGSRYVRETFSGQVVWEGYVGVFTLEDHPTATRGYAWNHALDDTEDRRVVAVLHDGPVDSPEAAVRAAVASETRDSED